MLSPQTRKSGFSTPVQDVTADQYKRAWEILGYLDELCWNVVASGIHIDEMYMRHVRRARALLEEVEGPINYSNSDIGGPEL